MIDSKLQFHTKNILKQGVSLLLNANITANVVTCIGLVFGLISALAIISQNIYITLTFLYLSGLCDILDGILARESGGGSLLGTLLDITFDRVVEMAILVALAYIYPQYMFTIIGLLASILFCITVFLTVGLLVQKSSHKTFFYASGIMERTEAFILFTLLIIFPQHIPIIGSIGTILIFITGIQRFVFAMKHFSND